MRIFLGVREERGVSCETIISIRAYYRRHQRRYLLMLNIVWNVLSSDGDESETESEKQHESEVNKATDSDVSRSRSPHLRLCQLKHWPQFVGYGFNLHISQRLPGEFIVGHVDDRSPAAAAGLLPGDHIIQVTLRALLSLNRPIVLLRPTVCLRHLYGHRKYWRCTVPLAFSTRLAVLQTVK